MHLQLCDDHGKPHVIRDATPREVADFGMRAWKSNSELAAKYDILPDPVVGLKQAVAALTPLEIGALSTPASKGQKGKSQKEGVICA